MATTAPMPDQSTPQYTVEEFGQRIKKKYPVYKDMSDVDVANKVLDKFPQYQSSIKTSNLPQPLERTPGNYASETLYGVGRGLKNDVVGLYSTVRHPINTVRDLYKGTVDASDKADKEARDLLGAYPVEGKTAMESIENDLMRTNAQFSKFLENFPLTAGMVNKAESGKGYASPESVGAAAEGITTYAAPEVLGKGIKGIAKSKFVSESLPRGLINNLIKPSAADVKFGKDPANAIIGEKITGNSLRQLGDNTYAKLQDVGKQLDAQAALPSNAGKIVDVTNALKPLDDAMVEATKAKRPELFAKLVELKKQLTSDYKPFRDAKGNITLRRIRPSNLQMTPTEALQFKRMVGDRIRWDGTDPFNDDLNAVKGKIYGSLKDDVNRAVPGLKALNERYSDLVGAAKAIERRTPIAERNSHWSLSDIALGATHHLPIAIARKVVGLPGVTTRVAQGLSKAKNLHAPYVAPIVGSAGVVGAGQEKKEITPPDGGQSSVSSPRELSERAKNLNQQKASYAHVAVNPSTNHRIGSNDGILWYDLASGNRIS